MRYRFGEYELDTGSRSLLRAGAPIQLWPKVFDLLQYLVERRGQLVTKQELLDHVWPDSHVAEGSVLWTVSHARRALEQHSGQKLPIETVYKRGYRFSASIEEVHETVAPPPRPTPPRPFVGRDGAMRQLEGRVRDAEELRRGELCVLVGPPGIGKTRCMDELSAVARRQHVDFWFVRCLEDAWAPVLLPWVLALREAARGRPALTARVEALLTRLQRADPVEPGNDALNESFWWLDGVTRLLKDAAAERSIVIALDDLQWADAASLDLLIFLAQELRHAPLVIVASIRADAAFAQDRRLKRLWRHAYRIDLERLTESDVARYVALITSETMRSDTLAALHGLTAGNPLFLEHTLRDLLARHGAGPLSQLQPNAISPAPIARDMLRSSLDRLPPRSRELLGVASVLGEAFDLSDLRAISDLDPEELLALIDPAVREGIVVASEPNVLHFCHALMRTVLYDDLPLQRRTTVHRKAAEALDGASASRLGEIANHYYRSRALGDHARVVAAAERAAGAAARLHAFADAARFSAWAVEAQDLETDTLPRTRVLLWLFHAEMQAGAGDVAAARATIESAMNVARSHGLYDLLVLATPVLRPYTLMASIEDPYLCALLEEALAHAPADANAARVSALSQLAWMPPYAHDTAQSKAMSSEALDLARQLQDKKLLLHALHARLHALSGPDDCAALLASADEMHSLGHVPSAWIVASVLSARYGAQLHRGENIAASATLAELGRQAHAHQWPNVIWVHDRLIVQDHIMRGDFAAAATALEALQRLADRWQISYAAEMHPVLQGLITLETRGIGALSQSMDRSLFRRGMELAPIGLRPFVARLQLELGDADAAKSVLLELSANDFAGLPRDIGYLGSLTSLAVLAVRLDDCVRAQRLYALLAPYSQFNTMSLLLLHEGSVSHFLGMLAAYLDNDADAAQHFDDAIAMNERMGWRPQLERTRRERKRWMSRVQKETR